MDMVLLFVSAYLIGSIPFAFLLARRVGGVDLRRVGSGNVGAANVARTAGIGAALTVAALDAAKGAAAVFLVGRAAAGADGPAMAGVAAIVGHLYPVWLRWRGGKGVATACGVFAVLAPVATVVAAGLFTITVWGTRYVSLGSVVATIALAPLAYVLHAPGPVIIAALCTAVLIIERHRPNLVRLQAGTERRFGQRA
jgi:glycerol-3-phosphate acyltransferase PlsY